MSKCLYCYGELRPGEVDHHPECAKKLFGSEQVPLLDYSRTEMDELARQVIQSQTTLTGVQPKLSLHLDRHRNSQKLTIVGLWGDFIFKPQSEQFESLPENEDLTMHLAQIARIKVVPHTLIRLKDGSLGYLTRRIDRTTKGEKIAMEDMCQLTERLTEHKYKSSYEQIAKAIRKYSSQAQMDVTDFLEVVYFSWLTGNNDMHLKNFSLYQPHGAVRLTPAYDLLNGMLANPSDDEQLALTLNGKKKRIGTADFMAAFETCCIPTKVFLNMQLRYQRLLPAFEKTIGESFLNEEQKKQYRQLLAERMQQ